MKSPFTVFLFIALAKTSFGAVVQYQVVNMGLTGTEVREIRDGKVAGFRYENSFLGTRNYEEGFTKVISTGSQYIYRYPNKDSTQIYTISTTDYNQVGGMIYSANMTYQVFGFSANQSSNTQTQINPPGAYRFSVESINGLRTVGWYDLGVSSANRGFIHQGTDYSTGFSTIVYPNANTTSTRLTGIQGDILVGTTTINSKEYGFIYDLSKTSDQFSVPLLITNSTATRFNDINDNFIVGTATIGGINKPFLVDFLTGQVEFFTAPEGYSAEGYSYDNGVIAGTYDAPSGNKLGFYATVPEPTGVSFLIMSTAFAVFSRRRR